jgi:hypothetical protein
MSRLYAVAGVYSVTISVLFTTLYPTEISKEEPTMESV